MKLVGILVALKDSNADTAGWIMPKLIEISSFQFKPIHSFIPQTVSPAYITGGNGIDVNAPFINYGKTNGGTDTGGGYGQILNTSVSTVNSYENRIADNIGVQ